MLYEGSLTSPDSSQGTQGENTHILSLTFPWLDSLRFLCQGAKDQGWKTTLQSEVFVLFLT